MIDLKNIRTPMELQNALDFNGIKYGYKSRDGKIYQSNEIDDIVWAQNYILQSPSEVFTSKVGVCWDFVEIYREWAEIHNIPCVSLYVEYNPELIPDAFSYATHTILVMKQDDKYNWYDNAYLYPHQTRTFNNIELLVDTLLIEHAKHSKKDLGVIESMYLDIYEYEKPEYGIGPNEFMEHCRRGKTLNKSLKLR